MSEVLLQLTAAAIAACIGIAYNLPIAESLATKIPNFGDDFLLALVLLYDSPSDLLSEPRVTMRSDVLAAAANGDSV